MPKLKLFLLEWSLLMLCLFGVYGADGDGDGDGDNDNVTIRIVGGQATTIRKVPYLVSLRYNGTFVCGGTLVHRRYVVSAAHCVSGKSTKRFTVVAGASKLSQSGKRARVIQINTPRAFNFNSMYKDVAVLRLNRPLSGKSIGTLSLCSTSLDAGKVLQVSGWGYTSQSSGRPSNQVHTVRVPIISQAVCARDYKNEVPLKSSMFCAAKPGTRDACTGDSGGPAVLNNQLCGIVSFGVGCAKANFPGVYTNVNVVREFIRKALRK